MMMGTGYTILALVMKIESASGVNSTPVNSETALVILNLERNVILSVHGCSEDGLGWDVK
jgi:hypothetical protein